MSKQTLTLPTKRLGRAAAARECGISVEQIDYYAHTKRLPFITNATGHREYAQDDVRKLKALRQKNHRRTPGVSDAVVA